DCSGCHTFPQFLSGGDPFIGTIRMAITPERNVRHYLVCRLLLDKKISGNLTPNLDTGLPSNMTLQQFFTAMHSGRGTSTGTLRIMTCPTYHNMTDQDVSASYQYLSAIPHAVPCNASCPPSYANAQDCPNPAPPR